jgi:hypothetical protein
MTLQTTVVLGDRVVRVVLLKRIAALVLHPDGMMCSCANQGLPRPCSPGPCSPGCCALMFSHMISLHLYQDHHTLIVMRPSIQLLVSLKLLRCIH